MNLAICFREESLDILSASTCLVSRSARPKTVERADTQSLVTEHRELAQRYAKNMLRQWRAYVPEEEIVSVSDLALCEAATRFNAERGVKFSSFLFYHLKGRIIRDLISKSKEQCRFLASGTSLEVCEIPAYGEKTSGSSSKGSHPHTSFSWLEMSSRPTHNLQPDELLYQAQVKELKDSALLKLNLLEKQVVIMLYSQGISASDAAKRLNCTPGYVSRIRTQALVKMKRHIDSRKGEARVRRQCREN